MRTRDRTGRERQCSRRADERAEEERRRDAKSAVVCCVSPLGSFSSFLLFSRSLDPFVACLESLGLLLYALPRLGLALTLEFALYTVANACVWLLHSRWCVLLLSFPRTPVPPSLRTLGAWSPHFQLLGFLVSAVPPASVTAVAVCQLGDPFLHCEEEREKRRRVFCFFLLLGMYVVLVFSSPFSFTLFLFSFLWLFLWSIVCCYSFRYVRGFCICKGGCVLEVFFVLFLCCSPWLLQLMILMPYLSAVERAVGGIGNLLRWLLTSPRNPPKKRRRNLPRRRRNPRLPSLPVCPWLIPLTCWYVPTSPFHLSAF